MKIGLGGDKGVITNLHLFWVGGAVESKAQNAVWAKFLDAYYSMWPPEMKLSNVSFNLSEFYKKGVGLIQNHQLPTMIPIKTALKLFKFCNLLF